MFRRNYLISIQIKFVLSYQSLDKFHHFIAQPLLDSFSIQASHLYLDKKKYSDHELTSAKLRNSSNDET